MQDGGVAATDGDGWALCARGHRHWGKYGAAGLLAVHHDRDGTPHLLMQKRAWWCHHGGTWGLPAGARDSHEDPVTAALREAGEEAALAAEGLRIQGLHIDDHGGWAFHTVIAEADGFLPAAPASSETTETRWIPVEEVTTRRLHPGFAATWPELRPALRPLVVILDMANIIGARAEHGWWRDRAGATTRLLAEVSGLVQGGLHDVPEGIPPLHTWYSRMIAVVEGAARSVTAAPGTTVVSADGHGDDAIVATVRDRPPWERVLVVTADRALRDRVTALGATVTGPKWLLGRL